MQQHILAPDFSEEEQRSFRLDDFPKTNSGRREFIFARTGFPAKPLDARGWYLFNRSMNEGMNIGLDERSVQILSLIDHALSGVKRFRGFAHMHEIAGDSTAAHTKQAMNIVEYVVERAAAGNMTAALDEFRRDALLSTWVHDMGEVVMELTIASDIFDMPVDKRAALSHEKNELERELFIFSIDLAAYAIDTAQPELFARTIEAIREKAHKATGITERMHIIKEGMQQAYARWQLPKAEEKETAHLVSLYDRAEEKEKGGFLHPFVKTLEAVEGHRYLQRNSGLLEHTKLEWITSNEIVEACKRSERRLPELFEQAGDDPTQLALAVAAAEFTYRSIARQFTPNPEDFVSIAPAYIHREPTPESEIPSGVLFPAASVPPLKATVAAIRERVLDTLDGHRPTKAMHAALASELEKVMQEMDGVTLEAERTRTQAALAGQWDKWGINKPIWSREETGQVYRAAEYAVTKGFRPQSRSLIASSDTPKIPMAIEQGMRDVACGKQPGNGKDR